MRHFQHQNVST